MPTNAAAENVLGTLGTVCWMIQLLPQVWKSWREKSTEGLSDYLVLLWSISAWFLGVYAIVQDLNIPLIVQPQIFGFLSLVSWAQCQYYGRRRPLRVCVLLFLIGVVLQAGFEVGMVYAVRPSFRAGNIRGTQFFGVMASILLSLGLFPQYYEIYKYREVIGISIPFMAIDLLGGVFSDLSLVFKAKFDVIAGVAYSLVVVLDGVVIVLALILNPLARRRRRREAAVPVPHGEDDVATEIVADADQPVVVLESQEKQADEIHT